LNLLIVEFMKILLINPSMKELYARAKVKASVPNYPPLNLLTISTPLLGKHEVKILDLLLYDDIYLALENTLKEFNPDVVGITFTTPLYSQVLSIVDKVKEFNERILVVAGGVHITSDTKNTLKKSKIDMAAIGEGDYTLLEILENSLENVKGIAYKKDGKIIFNGIRPYLEDLDEMPFPAFELINIHDYVTPYTFCKENPIAPLETSRGCVYGCVYCNKSVFGRTFRVKSPERVIQDVEKLIELGFKEIHLSDDGFTTDMKRAKEICQMVLDKQIKIHWNCTNGIRVDRVNEELLRLMKDSGFYRISFGVESGSQKILDRIEKKIKLEDIENAFKLCRKLGIETLAFFMFGLPDETEDDMQKSIEFAKKLKPDIVKFDIMIPLPSTPIFEEWKDKYIVSENWDDYGFYKEEKVYNHPNLSWETIKEYSHKSYKTFYLSPNFIIRRIFISFKNGTFLKDVKMFLSIKW